MWKGKSKVLSFNISVQSVQSLRHVRLFVTPWTAACQASLPITNFWSLPKLTSIESVMPSSHLNLCRLLLLLPSPSPPAFPFSSCLPLLLLPSPSPPAFNLSQHQSVFQSVSSSHQQPKYWSFNFSLSAFNEYSGLIFTMNWLDLLAGQGTLKSLLQHHNSKASILRRSAFFIVQLSHPYMTTRKTIALTRL